MVILASCNLLSPTQVGFWNTTTSYTFMEIKLGSIDYQATLAPGYSTPFFPINSGSYTLYTRGTNGILFQWPVPQPISAGHSCVLVFYLNNSIINYTTIN